MKFTQRYLYTATRLLGGDTLSKDVSQLRVGDIDMKIMTFSNEQK